MSGCILYSPVILFICIVLLPSAVQRKAVLGNAPGDSRHLPWKVTSLCGSLALSFQHSES